MRRVGTLVSRRFRSNVLLTLGARGIAFFNRDGGEPLVVPAEAQEVFDVSGAGDTVVAAFSLARAAGCEHVGGSALANRAAAVVVGKRGTATVTPDELLAAVKRLDRSVVAGLQTRPGSLVEGGLQTALNKRSSISSISRCTILMCTSWMRSEVVPGTTMT